MITVAEGPVQLNLVTEAVIVDGMPADDYHADRTSISSSGLRALLNPGCPAQFKYDIDHPQPSKKEFDFGHAAHKLVLGEGPDLEVVEGARWDTKDAKAQVAAIRERGGVPLKKHEYEQVQAMADAIRRHPLAGPLLMPGTGIAERSIWWTDPATGVRCRCRPDRLKQLPGLTLCVDYKSTRDASPTGISKAIETYGYHQQDALYVDGIEAAGLAARGSARFVFVFQSKIAPYLITVRELSEHDRTIGRAKNDRALRTYAECLRTDTWPDWTGPVTDIPEISLPAWAAIREAEEYLQ